MAPGVHKANVDCSTRNNETAERAMIPDVL